MKIPKEIIKKYSIENDEKRLIVNNPDGKFKTCIGIPEDEKFNVVNIEEGLEIHCKTAVITLWKDIHRTHITVF